MLSRSGQIVFVRSGGPWSLQLPCIAGWSMSRGIFAERNACYRLPYAQFNFPCHLKQLNTLSLSKQFTSFLCSCCLFFAILHKGENCIFKTLIVELRGFRTSMVDFVKITLQRLDSWFSWHYVYFLLIGTQLAAQKYGTTIRCMIKFIAG